MEFMMAGEKKLESPVTLFAAIEAEQHAALREIAYKERRSLADLVREALSEYLKTLEKKQRNRRPARTAHAP
ncbi:MAG TPA: ribbon-helix-helix protein, CopG family [Thermoanaerobaculia bacterium]|jgi:predicted HicB family RNase H-like nuclease|nr:ribbon-helix-helix protein, CopG family [Thermoanaerobaculia bacterium]